MHAKNYTFTYSVMFDLPFNWLGNSLCIDNSLTAKYVCLCSEGLI